MRVCCAWAPRIRRRYWGHWHTSGVGIEPVWPEGNGPKVYAYLKPVPAMEDLLWALRASGAPTLIVSGEIDAATRQRHHRRNIRFETRPVDLALAAAQCDLAILNAGHGTTASMLLAGKPCLLLPIFTEQLLTAQAVMGMGAARWVPLNVGEEIVPIVTEMLSNATYQQPAQAFAARYKGFVPGEQLPAIADCLDGLLNMKAYSSSQTEK